MERVVYGLGMNTSWFGLVWYGEEMHAEGNDVWTGWVYRSVILTSKVLDEGYGRFTWLDAGILFDSNVCWTRYSHRLDSNISPLVAALECCL